jgi:hypothetical protein
MVDIIKLATNLEDMAEYEPLPPGQYPAEIRDVEVKYSEKQPNGYFVISLRVDPADFPPDYDTANAPEGVVLTYARVSIPDPNNRKSVRPFKNFIRALGEDVNSDTFDPQAWIGKQLFTFVTKTDYQGAPVNNVESVSAVPQV